eukprot:g57471.t1
MAKAVEAKLKIRDEVEAKDPHSDMSPMPPKGGLFDQFFEGPEKLLEILWLPQEGSKSLRSLPRGVWEKMLKLVRCTVLSITSNDFFDAYVLSESSLLIYPNKLILKTCGTTTLLCALPYIIKTAKELCGLPLIDDLWYSRRNYFQPQAQRQPHGSWNSEVEFLDTFVQGSAYILGSTNDLHWMVYVTDFREPHSAEGVTLPAADDAQDFTKPPLQHKPSLSLLDAPRTKPKEGTCTFEMLMHDLDETVMRHFYNPQPDNPAALPALTKKLTKESGIGELIPGSKIDDYLFNPCGYSMNGLKGENYWTIHVTPQASCSYASFETDFVQDLATTLTRVVSVFKPALFTVSFIAHAQTKEEVGNTLDAILQASSAKGFVSRPRIRLDLDNGYELFFVTFRKPLKPLPTLAEAGSNGSKAPNDTDESTCICS